MSQPRSVMLVASEAGSGGMQAMMGMLASGLAGRGVRVDLVVGGSGALPAAVVHAVERDGGVELHRLPDPSGAAGLLRWVAALRGLVAERSPDVLHGHGLRTALPLVAAGRRRPSSILVTCHGLPREHLRRTTRLLRLSGVSVAAVGPGLADELRASGLGVELIENGVPPAPTPADRPALLAELGLDPSLPLVVCPARLSPQKDPVTLVSAMAEVPGASLLLLGDGPLAGEVTGRIAELDLGHRVAVEPWRDDARSILGAADLLAIASRWEGQPLVVVEAAMAGIPVVATSCPGVGDWLRAGSEALLTPVGDAEALGRSISTALFDAEVRRALREGGGALARRHSLEAMVDAHLSAYARL